MAKRLIDTAIFRKDFIRGLDAPCKLLFMYLINECDHAGLWDVEFEVMEIRFGLKFKESPFVQFGNKVVAVDGGKKWFIPSFVEFQYGDLKDNNRVHVSVINLLAKHNLLDENNQIKPLTSPSQGCKDMDMDKDSIVSKEKKEKRIGTNVQIKKFNPINHIPTNWNEDLFMAEWDDFMQMRKKKKWSCTEKVLKARLKQLSELSGYDWGIASAIMQKSSERGYAEFFAIDSNKGSNQIKNERREIVRDKA